MSDELFATLDAFLQEHRRCGNLDGGGDDKWVWMSCDCGAELLGRKSDPVP
jgi:hypothetical protein